MDASQLADIEGTLLTAGLVGVAVLVVLSLVAPARSRALRDSFTGLGLWVAAAIALGAAAGSLWFSEVSDFPPCKLCWYQRIAMYPLVPLLGIAAARRDAGMRLYGLVMVGLGLAVSSYHNVIETFPDADPGSCDPAAPCTVRWVEGLGFWTIPRMAFASFVLVGTALLADPALSRRRLRGADDAGPDESRPDEIQPAPQLQEQ